MGTYPTAIYLNGAILKPEDANISVFDRGFIFGDGVYEVMAQTGCIFLFKDAHLNRLKESLDKIQIDFDVATLDGPIEKVLSASGLKETSCLLYVQITRGVAPRAHAFPKDTVPTVMLYAMPFDMVDINQKKLSTITLTDKRWHRCDIKMTSLLGNTLAKNQAIENGGYESIMIRDNVVTEGSHCNVFFVKDKVVYTHPSNELILNGITRQVVLSLCYELGIDVKQEPVPLDQITQMDEAFLTGTTTQIASIKQIDNHTFYEGEASGFITQKLQKAYLTAKNDCR